MKNLGFAGAVPAVAMSTRPPAVCCVLCVVGLFFHRICRSATFKIPHLPRYQFDTYRTRLQLSEKSMQEEGRKDGNSSANAESNEDESRDYLRQ